MDEADTMNLLLLADIGWHIFPIYGIEGGECQCDKPSCTSKGKHPVTANGMKAATCDAKQIEAWIIEFPNCNWAVNCVMSDLVCLDVDPRSGGDESLSRIESRIKDSLPSTSIAKSGMSKNLHGKSMRGTHFYYKYRGDVKFPINLNQQGLVGIDIKHNGYVLIPHSKHASGHRYEWMHDAAPWEKLTTDLPEELIQIIFPKKVKSSLSLEVFSDLDCRLIPETYKPPIDLEKFFNTNLLEGERSNKILSAACAMAARDGVDATSRERIVKKFLKFNNEFVIPSLDDKELVTTVTNGIDWVTSKKEKQLVSIYRDDNPDAFNGELLVVPMTESSSEGQIAEWLGSIYFANSLVWCQSMKWMHYKNGFWKPVPTEFVVEMVRILLVRISLKIHKEQGVSSLAKKAMSFETNNKLQSLATLMKGICLVQDDVFDAFKEHLNVKNGVVNLQTGELMEHSHMFYFTNYSDIKYSPDARHPDWDKALEALPPNVADYAQLRFGQGVTGQTPRDDKVLFCIGGGENGKTTFMTSLKTALGSYLSYVPQKVLMGNKNDHPTEIMTLKGVRLAIIEELPEGHELPIEQLKRITGVTHLTARSIGQNNQTFEATHTLVVTTNTLPNVSRYDHATWRRFEVIEFPYRFSQDITESSESLKVGDGDLRTRLMLNETGQGEAVLSWLVEGAVKLKKLDGKMPTPPKEIQDSLTQWRKSSDFIYKFLIENFEIDPMGFMPSTTLYEMYRKIIGGTHSDSSIAQKLKTHGYLSSLGISTARKIVEVSGVKERVMVWEGIKLK